MNQPPPAHYASGQRGRGGRNHGYQGAGPGRFHSNDRRFQNMGYHKNVYNNNNHPKCFNQNVEHNPNMDRTDYMPTSDRTFVNPAGDMTYAQNEATGYAMEPMYASGTRMFINVPHAFNQPPFADMAPVPPHMMQQPIMQVVNYPPPTPHYPVNMQPNVLYNCFTQPQPGIPPHPEQFGPIKEESSRSQSRESYISESGDPSECQPIPQSDFTAPPPCPHCANVNMSAVLTINSLRNDIEKLEAKNRVLQEEIAFLKAERQAVYEKQKKDEAAAITKELVEKTDSCKVGLSVNAEPFVARDMDGKSSGPPESCSGDGSQNRQPDPVEQGYENKCTELIDIITDDSNCTRVAQVQTPRPAQTCEIPVVSANTKWSEMVDREIESSQVEDGDPRPAQPRGRSRLREEERPNPSAFLEGRGLGANRRPQHANDHRQRTHQNRNAGGCAPRGIDPSVKHTFTQPDNRGNCHPGNMPNSRGAGPYANRGHSNRGFRGDARCSGGRQNADRQWPKAEESRNWRSPDNLQEEKGHRSEESTNTPPIQLNRTASVEPNRKDLGKNVDEELEKSVGNCDLESKEWGRKEKSREDREESCGPQKGAFSDNYERGGSGDRHGHRDEPGPRSDPRRAKPSIIKEIHGDLFTASETMSLAHCVAVDMRMGSGIAVNFRDKFKRVDELLDQRKEVGDVAILSDKGRFIYYLVTKQRSQGKPTMATLERSLRKMAAHCRSHGITQLAMPRIGCGLDKLDWSLVSQKLEEVFGGSGVAITIYNYPQFDEQRKDDTPKRKSLLWLVQRQMNLVDIESSTGLIYLCAEDGTVTPTMNSLDAKHHFLPNFRAAKLVCGDILETTKGNEVLFGLIVKKNWKDPFSYVNLTACWRKLRQRNNQTMFEYFGMEAFRDGDDSMTMTKVATCLRNVFGGGKYRLEFWMCFPEEFSNDMDEPPSANTSGSNLVETTP